ncbi:hypothetical protein ABFS82_13G165100 [Erythranthe guttata]|uniref:Small ubiquitin-related modifier n=1 Tax=Erythranthe guttata TaxID=4155 RepID=A0A022QLM1_ERYGU|nr:PREDICTED: small ubiquitin-related modifier 1-like [Erythranthe guttata]EYU27370.1 hypothetical protein MIMGU_mgv1a022663mg [Erythranthe guttata]|eukprot:XP_012848656.1 PREDICTED: small ubiquitin-related modifier 1-like [Erythranthe guttata]
MSTSGEEENQKPIAQPGYVNIKVNSQDGKQVFFRINRNTPLKKLMCAYRAKESLDNSIVFLFNGGRIRETHTPDKLEMKDGDEIDAMSNQIGGATSTDHA